MSVTASDLVFYTSANMPIADTGTSGGAVALTNKIRPVFSTGQMSGVAVAVEVASDGTSDGGGKKLKVTGRAAGGTITSETILVSASAGSYTAGLLEFERILKLEFLTAGDAATNATGTLTIRKASGGTTLTTIQPGEHGIHVLFYDSAAPTSGTTLRYEKIYIRNNNATNDLTNATAQLTSSTNSIIDWGFAAVASTQSITARKDSTTDGSPGDNAPPSVTFFGDSAAHSITALSGEVATGGTLAATEARGIWLKQTTTNATPATKGVANFTVAGSTT